MHRLAFFELTLRVGAQDVFLQINYQGQCPGWLQLEHKAQSVGTEGRLSSDQMIRDWVMVDFRVFY